jgi:hypothetical protein
LEAATGEILMHGTKAHIKPESHPTVFNFELGCNVDKDVAVLVWALNRISGVHTISSCQGEDVGNYGYVAFRVDGDTVNLFQLCCYCIRPALEFLNNGKRPRDGDLFLDVDIVKDIAWLRFTKSVIPKITEAIMGITDSHKRGAY